MHQRGWKAVGGSFSVGWPDINTAKDVGAGLAACDYWSVHEYSAPSMYDGDGWYTLRYRKTVTELKAAGFPIRPLIITECGIDGGVIGRPKTGWKSFVGEEEYLNQLKWYDSELMRDEYVKAATIFVGGPNQDWTDFEVTESLATKLSSYIQVTPNPPEEDVAKARGIDVSRWQKEIDFDKVKADGYSFVIIRASGPNDDRTAVVKDPYFDQNYERAKAAGLLVGAYHGLQDVFPGQALLFVESVGDRELDLGYFADLEASTLSDAKCSAHVNAVDARLVKRFGWPEGKYCKIYTSPGFMSGRDTSFAEGRDLWLAHWTDNEDNIIIPSPWTEYEFWQYGVGDAGFVDGISTRIDLNLFKDTVQALYEKYKKEDDGDMVEVVDVNGNVVENGWADAVARGAELVSASPPAGATVWRVKRLILDNGGSMAFRTYAVDKNNAPIKGIAILEGWNDGDLLPDDAAPRLSETVWEQPNNRPNKALLLSDQFTNIDGYLEWTWGSGEFIGNEPPHWVWVMPGGEKWFSDVMFVPGWWDEHIKYWVVFEKQESGDVPVDPPIDPPIDGDLTEVVVQLKRIADSLEVVSSRWPFP